MYTFNGYVQGFTVAATSFSTISTEIAGHWNRNFRSLTKETLHPSTEIQVLSYLDDFLILARGGPSSQRDLKNVQKAFIEWS
jgi:hypothetical protein